MSEQSISERCVVAFRPCGCLSAVAMERSSMAPDVMAQEQWPGYRVEHLTMSEYHAALKRCADHPRQERQERPVRLPGFETVPERPAQGRPSWTA